METSFRFPLIAIAALALLAPAGSPAQMAPAEPLTLERAVALARIHNPDLRRALNEVERAVAAERSGWGSFLPDIQANGSITDFSSRTLTGRNEYGQPVELPEAASISGTQASGSVTASLTLFSGFRTVNELRAARAGRRSADALHAGEADRIEAEVARRYYDAVGAARLVEVEERLFAGAVDRLAAMRAMENAGRATPQDVLGAEADLARQENSLDAARSNAYVTRLLLGEAIGLEDAAALEVVDEFPELADPSALAEDDVVDRALRANPRVARTEAAAARAGHAASAVRASRLPTVRLGVGFDRGISLEDRGQLMDFPWNRGWGVQLSASVPLFTGFDLTERIVQARTVHSDAVEEQRRARLAVEREARSAWSQATTAYHGVRRAERASALELQRMETAQEGFRRGLIGFTELQQLIDRAALAERAAVRAQMDYARAMATLREVLGGPAFGGGRD